MGESAAESVLDVVSVGRGNGCDGCVDGVMYHVPTLPAQWSPPTVVTVCLLHIV